MVFMISASVAPFFRWSMATTRAVLLPSRGPSAFGFLGRPAPRSAGCLVEISLRQQRSNRVLLLSPQFADMT